MTLLGPKLQVIPLQLPQLAWSSTMVSQSRHFSTSGRERKNINESRYAFLINSLKNLFPLKKGKWAKATGKGRWGVKPEKKSLKHSVFFPDNYRDHKLVLRKKDFLQLFGDRSKAKLEPPWRCVFFGSDDFSVRVLQLLHGTGLALVPGEGLISVIDVCTNLGKKGSVNPVENYARKHGFNLIEYPIPRDKQLEGYDVGLLASFGHMVPTRLIQSFPYGILNVHPSLLPRWRGASPCIHTILNGDAETGVTIMQVAPRHFDIGPIVLQQRFPLPQQPPLSSRQLASWMAWEGGMLLLETLERLPKLAHRPVEQSACGITYAHKIGPETGNVNWLDSLTTEIRRQFLAVGEIYGLRSVIGSLYVTFYDMVDVGDVRIDSLVNELHPGSHFFHKRRKVLCVRCQDGWVGFSKLKITGKKVTSAADFHNGYLSKTEFADELFQSLPNNINEDIFSSRVRKTIASVTRDDFVIVTHGHDCLLEGKNGKRFVTAL